jgi:hypothetical protein
VRHKLELYWERGNPKDSTGSERRVQGASTCTSLAGALLESTTDPGQWGPSEDAWTGAPMGAVVLVGRAEVGGGATPSGGGNIAPCPCQRRHHRLSMSRHHPPSAPWGGPGQCGESGAWTHPSPPRSPAPRQKTCHPSQRRRAISCSSA